jgi:hypothetical protein
MDEQRVMCKLQGLPYVHDTEPILIKPGSLGHFTGLLHMLT